MIAFDSFRLGWFGNWIMAIRIELGDRNQRLLESFFLRRKLSCICLSCFEY